jgi:hypothetical protein
VAALPELEFRGRPRDFRAPHRMPSGARRRTTRRRSRCWCRSPNFRPVPDSSPVLYDQSRHPREMAGVAGHRCVVMCVHFTTHRRSGGRPGKNPGNFTGSSAGLARSLGPRIELKSADDRRALDGRRGAAPGSGLDGECRGMCLGRISGADLGGSTAHANSAHPAGRRGARDPRQRGRAPAPRAGRRRAGSAAGRGRGRSRRRRRR